MQFVIGLLIAFVLVAIYTHRTMGTRNCRWRAAREKDRDGLHYYYCAACGAETLTESPTVPKVCHAPR
ncbi:MAG: hypothetical protein AAGF27_10460 [Pseudomonadota bacterium]